MLRSFADFFQMEKSSFIIFINNFYRRSSIHIQVTSMDPIQRSSYTDPYHQDFIHHDPATLYKPLIVNTHPNTSVFRRQSIHNSYNMQIQNYNPHAPNIPPQIHCIQMIDRRMTTPTYRESIVVPMNKSCKSFL